MIVPYQQISPDTLDGLIEAFINREGTDYGVEEFSLNDKVAQVKRQLQSGGIVIVFDAATESINLLPKLEATAFLAQQSE